MIYVAELMDIKKNRNDSPMCLLKIGETKINCLLGRSVIERDVIVKKIKDFPIGEKYKFDIWIDAAQELDTISEKIKKMPIPEDDFYFDDFFAGVVIEMLGEKDGAPEVKVETENGFVFDVTDIHGWEDLKQMKPGDYVEIWHGYYFIKDIYPLDYEG